ncbi:MAG TPA: hypothetical protein VNA14_07535 [Mycobacteriales bacterium]|nr:hypothetical protein [Mycobacteriales bacterium]
MADVRCVDGSTLGVHPEPVVDRHGIPYELTLRLTRDGAPFGAVGERCGWFLASTAARLAEAAADSAPAAARWPSSDDRFPMSSVEGGLRAWAVDQGLDADATWTALERYLPRDRDLFAFRHRDPDDLASAGELRCSMQTERSWINGAGVAGGGGRWRLACRAVLDAWGDAGVGVRAVLSAPELAAFLRALLDEAAVLGCEYDAIVDDVVVRRPAG